MGMRKVFLLLFMVMATCLHAQRNEIFDPRIASLQVVAGSRWQSLPVVMLGSGEAIHIAFDDLTHTYHRYTYRIDHCEADWSISRGLFASDYISGFYSGNTIDDNCESVGTNTLYTHYQLRIPNERCTLKMSGNYRLTVFDENNDDQPMFTAHFMVAEAAMGVSLGVSTNTDIDLNGSHQQVDMQVNYGGQTVIDPARQLKTVVLQNGRWDNAVVNPQPRYVMPDGLRWTHERSLIFEAGNEYRKFEALDVDRPTLGVNEIRWDGRDYHVMLYPDEIRRNYVYDEDANGAFYIRNSDNHDNDCASEYVVVHFTLHVSQPVAGDVYLNGAWTNDRFLPQYRMEYDAAAHCYRCAISLKQGYYSYQYVVLHGDGSATVFPIEGSFYQTGNRYQALVYFRANEARADRLVGYTEIDFKR